MTKNNRPFMSTALIVFISTLLHSSFTFANEPVSLGQREVILNNDSVEVVRLTYPAGTQSGMHSHNHPNRTVYFERGGKLELIPADSTQDSQILSVADGKILYLPANTHNVKNIGDTTVIIVEHELKVNKG